MIDRIKTSAGAAAPGASGWQRLQLAFDQLDIGKAMLLVVLGAMLLRLAFVIFAAGVADPNSMDSQNYLRIARNLVAGNGFVVWHKPTIYVAPLYPTLLAGMQLLFGESILAIRLLQVLLGGATAWLVFLLGREIFNRQIGFLAALAFAVHPEMIALTAFIYTEIVFIFLLVLTLWLAARAFNSGELKWFVLAGLVLGVTNLCRGTLMYFPAFLLVLLLLYSGRQRWQRLAGIAVFTVMMAAAMAPWTIRNYLQFDAFVPVASGMGDVLWTGNYLPFDGEFRYEQTQRKLNEIVGDASFVERDRILIEETKKNWLAAPAESLWLLARKPFRYWFRVYENVPTGEARQKNWLVFGVLAFSHYALLGVAVLGLYKARLKNPLVVLLLVLIGYYTLVHTLTLPVVRYRQPLIPAMCVLAGAAVAGWLQRRPKEPESSNSKLQTDHQAVTNL